MHDFARWWEMGGGWMTPILLLGALGLLVGFSGLVVSLAIRQVRGLPLILATVVVGLGVLTVLVGLAGREHQLQRVEEVAAAVGPEDRETILLEGSSEARTPTMFGWLMGAGPLLFGISMLGWGLHRVRVTPNGR